MWMKRKARFVIAAIFRLKMIEQQERIEIIKGARADAPFKSDAGALDHRLGFNDLQDASWR
jgi:hypothetical protein